MEGIASTEVISPLLLRRKSSEVHHGFGIDGDTARSVYTQAHTHISKLGHLEDCAAYLLHGQLISTNEKIFPSPA